MWPYRESHHDIYSTASSRYHYHCSGKTPNSVYRFPTWLSADWSHPLDPRRHRGCLTSNQSFSCQFCQTFGLYLSGMLPTTLAKVNSCSCGGATSAGIVKRGESWLDEERLYPKRGPRLSHPWRRKHSVSIWVHRFAWRWIHLYDPDPPRCVDY
jgi:hypothetical protein